MVATNFVGVFLYLLSGQRTLTHTGGRGGRRGGYIQAKLSPSPRVPAKALAKEDFSTDTQPLNDFRIHVEHELQEDGGRCRLEWRLFFSVWVDLLSCH